MNVYNTKLVLDQLGWMAQKNSINWCVENSISSLELIVSEYGHIGAIFYLTKIIDKHISAASTNTANSLLARYHRNILLEMLDL